MDKDSTILKFLKSEAENAENELTELDAKNLYKEKALDRMDQRFDEIYALLNKKSLLLSRNLNVK